jgi:hypothetical protein
MLLEKLIFTQTLKKKFTGFMEPEGSLPCSKLPASGIYPELCESRPHLLTLFPKEPV